MIYNVLCMYHNPIGILNTLSMKLHSTIPTIPRPGTAASWFFGELSDLVWCLCSIMNKKIYPLDTIRYHYISLSYIYNISNAASRKKRELRLVPRAKHWIALAEWTQFDSLDLRFLPVEISCDGRYKHLGAAVGSTLCGCRNDPNFRDAPISWAPANESWFQDIQDISKACHSHHAHIFCGNWHFPFFLPQSWSTFSANFCFPYLLVA